MIAGSTTLFFFFESEPYLGYICMRRVHTAACIMAGYYAGGLPLGYMLIGNELRTVGNLLLSVIALVKQNWRNKM